MADLIVACFDCPRILVSNIRDADYIATRIYLVLYLDLHGWCIFPYPFIQAYMHAWLKYARNKLCYMKSAAMLQSFLQLAQWEANMNTKKRILSLLNNFWVMVQIRKSKGNQELSKSLWIQ